MCLTTRFVPTYKYGNDNPCVAVKGMKKKYFDGNTIRRVFGYLNEYEGAYKAIGGLIAQKMKNGIYRNTLAIKGVVLNCEYISRRGWKCRGGGYNNVHRKKALIKAEQHHFDTIEDYELYINFTAFNTMEKSVCKKEKSRLKKITLINKLKKHYKYDFVGQHRLRKGGKSEQMYRWILTHKVRDLPIPFWDNYVKTGKIE